MKLHKVIVLAAIPFLSLALLAWVQSSAQAEETRLKDRPAIVLKKVKPDFPPVLKRTRIYEGTTRVVFILGKNGEKRDIVVMASTHPAFSNEAKKNIEKWEISPAILNGQYVDTRFVINIHFKQKGIIVINNPIGHPDDIKVNQLDDFYYRVTEVNELDAPLKTVTTVMPHFPEDMKLYELSGQALIEFFVDPKGNVLAPGILSSSNEQCAYSALGAIVEWKFEPPLKKRKPVYVRARQPFFFEYIEPPPAQLEDKGLLPNPG